MADGIIRALAFAVVIFVLSEIAKRSSVIAAIVASFPFAAIGAAYLLFMEKQSDESIRAFISKTALFLPPSLVFFIGLPIAMKRGLSFSVAMPLFVFLTFAAYAIYFYILRKFGIDLSQ